MRDYTISELRKIDDAYRSVVLLGESSTVRDVEDDGFSNLRFKFIDDWDAKRIVSSISRRTDNERMDVGQFKKYYEDPKKRWFACFDGGKCMSLSVLKRMPQDADLGIRDIVLLAEIQSIVSGYGKPLIEEILSRYPNVWWAAEPDGGEELKEYYRQFVGGRFGMKELKVRLSGWSGKPQSFFWRADDRNREKLIVGLLKSVECGGKTPKRITFPEHERERISKKVRGDRIYTTRVSDEYSKYGRNDLLSLELGGKLGRKRGYVTRVWDLKDAKEHPFYDELTDSEREFLGGYGRIRVLEINVM